MNEYLKIAGIDLRDNLSDCEQRLWVRAEQISLMASVGIHRGEKDCRQEIILNIAAEISEPEADRISDVIDYRTLVQQAKDLSEEGHYELIETFICELGRRLIRLGRINAVDLELYKPAAIPPAMASVRFQIRRPALPSRTWKQG